MANNSVLQDWVTALHWKDQTTLISSIRGCDNEDDDYKELTRSLRGLILNNADKPDKVGGFMNVHTILTDVEIYDIINKAKSDTSVLGEHWLGHMAMAIQMLGKRHPNIYVRCYWSGVYNYLKEK